MTTEKTDAAPRCTEQQLVGRQFYWQGDTATVMAVVDGYAMAKTDRRSPFVLVAALITDSILLTPNNRLSS